MISSVKSQKTLNRFLSFDFGEKRIGIATGYKPSLSTQALTVLACKNDQPQWQEVEKLIKEWQVDAFVVGLPLNMDDSEQAFTQKAKKFADRLHGRFGLPAFLHDERLSSVEVKEYLFEIGGYKKVNQEIDAYAAELILKSYFESV
ncbi:Holliday junction resolvase RuvX [Kangiella sp. TOML190]|uniref:Holliday junction resolvase RuvX n=1 Tax=Kangiella sp. TOML190 TaxID=2931351 RepID=UPI0020423685|nr:Holliday junction resolvase RuvX [Kangiella sp. TOML190]